MGRKGKGRGSSRSKSRGSRAAGGAGGIISAASEAISGRGGGGGGGQFRTGGLYRVTLHKDTGEVSVMKVSKPKRGKRGYKMPRVVREQLDANRRLTEAVAMRVMAGGHV